jgi:hypothetical protein
MNSQNRKSMLWNIWNSDKTSNANILQFLVSHKHVKFLSETMNSQDEILIDFFTLL